MKSDVLKFEPLASEFRAYMASFDVLKIARLTDFFVSRAISVNQLLICLLLHNANFTLHIATIIFTLNWIIFRLVSTVVSRHGLPASQTSIILAERE